MNQGDYEFLSRFLKERSGLALGPSKEYLVQSRLGPIVRSLQLSSLEELIGHLRRGGDKALEQTVVDAMTTNESFFFRDKTPFDTFRDFMVPTIAASGTGRNLRVWCAAASTGQEPYSLAILLKEMASGLPGWNTEIVATDIAAPVLERAKAGVYTQFEVQRGLPIKLLMKYFKQEGDKWQIDAGLREMVKFETLNLLDDFTRLGTFDIVFCRNVLIYFDEATKREILARIAKRMTPNGYLVLGAAETIVGITDAFRTVPGKQGVCTPAGAAEPASAPGAASDARATVNVAT